MARAEEFFRGVGITVVAGIRYLGDFIGNRKAEDTWMAEEVQGWEEMAKTLLGFARKHLQSAYVGLQKSLQQEW